ncbi:MAG: hypothetical protein ACK4UJ_09685 [Leptonema sp. (in: bacteria)]
MMAKYKVPTKQSKETNIFLRIMIYSPYRQKLKKIKKRFKTNSEMFFYLIFKYKVKFDHLVSQKSSSKQKYQPITYNYKNIGIRVAPAIHQTLNDLSYTTGYSISALVRFLIEWEYSEQDKEKHNFLNNELIVNLNTSLEKIITHIEIKHTYFIQNERVEESFIWGFS